jgi:hypothetical protein
MCAHAAGAVSRSVSWLWRPGATEKKGDNSVSDELSLAELEGELCVELPTKNLMRHHRMAFRKFHRVSVKHVHHFNRCDGGGNEFDGGFNSGFGGGFNSGFGGARAFASFGSAANANSTFQSNFNPQFAFGGGGISISSHNSNFNATSQFAAPINFGF